MGKHESNKNKPLSDMHGDGISYNHELEEKKKEKEREWEEIKNEQSDERKKTKRKNSLLVFASCLLSIGVRVICQKLLEPTIGQWVFEQPFYDF